MQQPPWRDWIFQRKYPNQAPGKKIDLSNHKKGKEVEKDKILMPALVVKK
ncbi:hypothetical protein [Caldithrix abyssi]|uniref:Uncharacterized protein n=1 Tax=Caldithrix abyssi DSM 13497 TaxID=880073 RepID=A0A1J1CC12_CALAY|nr:hypothetical protein [Caldithrix abyssi]APF20243.1 hypothetical protein Cabys_3497 [Caldithrix abyssi DSM 13497]